MSRSSRRVWSWPAALWGATLFGLFSALLGEAGLWWYLSWGALALPLLAIAFCLCRSPHGTSSSDERH